MFPSIKLTITSAQKQMASAIAQQNINAIWEFMPILKNEVRHVQFAKDYTRLVFHNDAILDCIANAESSRGLRRHGLSVEEVIHERFDEESFNSVLLPIMANTRMAECGGEDPWELHKPLTFVTTSGNRQSFAWTQLQDTLKAMMQGKSAFVIGAGYELPCMHKLLSIDYVNDLKEGDSYNPLIFAREMESTWTGTSDNSLVSLDNLQKCRTLKKAEWKADPNKDVEYVLSYDVARSLGSQNASSALTVIKLVPRGDGSYQKFLVNIFKMNGVHFAEQARFIKNKVNEFRASVLCLDINGIGSGLCDILITEHDENPPYSVVNDSRYDKYKTQNSVPMIFAINSSSKETKASDIHNIFVNMISNQKVKLLESESQARSHIRRKDSEQLHHDLMPYILSDLLCDEIMNLEYKQSGVQTQVKQVSSRIDKDMFSSLEYGLFYIHLLEKKNKTRRKEAIDVSNFFAVKPPEYRVD